MHKLITKIFANLKKEAIRLSNGNVDLSIIEESILYALKEAYDAGFDLGAKFKSSDEKEE